MVQVHSLNGDCLCAASSVVVLRDVIMKSCPMGVRCRLLDSSGVVATLRLQGGEDNCCNIEEASWLLIRRNILVGMQSIKMEGAIAPRPVKKNVCSTSRNRFSTERLFTFWKRLPRQRIETVKYFVIFQRNILYPFGVPIAVTCVLKSPQFFNCGTSMVVILGFVQIVTLTS